MVTHHYYDTAHLIIIHKDGTAEDTRPHKNYVCDRCKQMKDVWLVSSFFDLWLCEECENDIEAIGSSIDKWIDEYTEYLLSMLD